MQMQIGDSASGYSNESEYQVLRELLDLFTVLTAQLYQWNASRLWQTPRVTQCSLLIRLSLQTVHCVRLTNSFCLLQRRVRHVMCIRNACIPLLALSCNYLQHSAFQRYLSQTRVHLNAMCMCTLHCGNAFDSFNSRTFQTVSSDAQLLLTINSLLLTCCCAKCCSPVQCCNFCQERRRSLCQLVFAATNKQANKPKLVLESCPFVYI